MDYICEVCDRSLIERRINIILAKNLSLIRKSFY